MWTTLPHLSAAPGILLLCTLYYISLSFVSWYRLRKFKGPFLASISYLWMVKTAKTARGGQIYAKLHEKYGPLYRIGPNELAASDPDTIRLMSAARSTYARSSWYDAMRLDPSFDSMFSLRDVAAHDKLKAQTAAGYAGKENPTLEIGVDEQILSLKEMIRRKYLSTDEEWKPLDFARTVQYFTLDSITRIAYGKAFGYIQGDTDVYDYIQTTEEIVPFMQLSAEVPVIQKIMGSTIAQKLIGPTVKDKKGMGKLMAVANEVVAERFGPAGKDQRDMLGAFVRHGLSQRQCETEVLFQIIAGSDTTATAIRATMLYIITTPYVYYNLREEIDMAIKENKISSPIKNDEAKSLKYLQAIIYEGLRIHAPFTGLIMKEVPKGGDTLHGQFVPGGTRIAHSTWSVLRNTSVFGDDVELFRPERWLAADPAKRSRMEKTTELAFGHGRWGCAGKPVAFLELNKVFVELLRDFDFQLINPTNPWTSSNYQLFMQSNMWVRVTAR